jgi:hypothetical protein
LGDDPVVEHIALSKKGEDFIPIPDDDDPEYDSVDDDADGPSDVSDHNWNGLLGWDVDVCINVVMGASTLWFKTVHCRSAQPPRV